MRYQVGRLLLLRRVVDAVIVVIPFYLFAVKGQN